MEKKLGAGTFFGCRKNLADFERGKHECVCMEGESAADTQPDAVWGASQRLSCFLKNCGKIYVT